MEAAAVDGLCSASGCVSIGTVFISNGFSGDVSSVYWWRARSRPTTDTCRPVNDGVILVKSVLQ